MDQDYTAPHKALQKLKAARKLCHTVYLYGATGYGKTELVKQYLSNRRYGRRGLGCRGIPRAKDAGRRRHQQRGGH